MIPPRPETIFVGMGILSIATGLPLADRRIPRNRWYGVRIRETFGDEQIWYEVNALAGRDLTVLGVLLVLAALTLPAVLAPQTYVASIGLAFAAGAMLMLVRSVRLARRLWRERGPGGGRRDDGP
jgi:hypothetical protein